MTLDEALRILADCHTRNSEKIGFEVSPDGFWIGFIVGHNKYVEAWEVVRKHLGMQTEPDAKTAKGP